jgi:hypothetical protein
VLAIKIALGIVVGVTLRLVGNADSHANHPLGFTPENIHDHLLSMTSSEPETYCIYVTSDAVHVTQLEAEAKIGAILSDDAGWRRVREDGTLVDFESVGACHDIQPDIRLELRFWVTASGCGGPNSISCVLDRYFDEVNVITGHREYRSMDVYVNNLHIDQDFCSVTENVFCSYHTINHETGHVLGLADAPPCTPAESIMHNIGHYCTYNWTIPDVTDIGSVELMIPASGGGGGNFGKGFF